MGAMRRTASQTGGHQKQLPRGISACANELRAHRRAERDGGSSERRGRLEDPALGECILSGTRAAPPESTRNVLAALHSYSLSALQFPEIYRHFVRGGRPQQSATRHSENSFGGYN